jgi:flagellar basal body-associated protein FliL
MKGMSNPLSRILKIVLLTLLSIVALGGVTYVSWFFYINSPYVADVGACRIENPECNESETSSAKVSYDSMDGSVLHA